MHSADLVAVVQAALCENSQESSELVRVKRIGKGERESTFARFLSTTYNCVYMFSVPVCSAMSFNTFLGMARLHFPEVRYAHGLTDYCDHCHFYRASVLKEFWRYIQEARQRLAEVHKQYFATFDASMATAQAATEDVCRYAEAFYSHVSKHGELHQAERESCLSLARRADLHRIEAEVEDYLRWEIQVLKAYAWHRKSNSRQKDSLGDARASMSPGELLVWYDWMQYVTLPLAHTQTANEFYGTARMETPVFGAYILQHIGDERGAFVKYVVVVSAELDHTALRTGQVVDELKKHVERIRDVKRISVWMDCGPHFRAYEHLAYWQREWFTSDGFRGEVVLNWFVEKHGKGLVDGLFGRVRGWIREFLTSKKDQRIVEVSELVDVLTQGAKLSQLRDPHGSAYHVEFLVKPNKPSRLWRLEPCPFQIQKTYCVSLRPAVRKNRTAPDWRNHVFSDLVDAPTEALKISCIEVPVAAGLWRTGYYGERKWDLKKPKKGSKSTMMVRREAQEHADIDDDEHRTQWERTTMAIVRRQALRRARQQRVSKAIVERIEAALCEEGDASDASDADEHDLSLAEWAIKMTAK